MRISRDNIENFVGNYYEPKKTYLSKEDLVDNLYPEKHYVKIAGPIIIFGRTLKSMMQVDLIYWDDRENSWNKIPANALYFELERYRPVNEDVDETLKKIFG